MAEGLSLHVGLNLVDPRHYDGWIGALTACEADATSMEAIAESSGFTTRTLLTTAATRSGVTSAIKEASDSLAAGDIFLISYAGHGGYVPDVNGDEVDGRDETWCLYDGELIDDELWQLWQGFAAGVRILVVSDSCHSGTVTRASRGQLDLDAVANELRAFGIDKPVHRFMPPTVALRTYRANKTFYDELGRSIPSEDAAPAAAVLLISGCQDDQTSSDGMFNGLFTGTLLKVWDDGVFSGDYSQFHAEIVGRMPSCQQPNHFVVGASDPVFNQQKPFTVTG
jgi:metacaspase-1